MADSTTGAYSLTLSTPLADGAHSIDATATLNNATSAVSAATSVNVETATPVITLATSPLATNASPAILGSAAAGFGADALSVQLTSDADYSTGSSVSLVNGNVVYTPGNIAGAASDTISYTVTDEVTGTVTNETQTVSLNPASLAEVWSFTGGVDGEGITGGVVRDAAGDMFGTSFGGTTGPGCVFEVAADSNSITTLANFDVSNGVHPTSGLIADNAGNLFGTTSVGGVFGNGTVFEIAAGSSSITDLASFDGGNGDNPFGSVNVDAAGNLYGTTVSAASG